MQSGDVVTLMVFFFAILFISVMMWAVPVRLWIEALSAGARVGMGYLVGMRLRKVPPASVVRPLIWATKAGIPVNVNDLEAHYLAGGQVDRVVRALISADKANIELPFKQAAAIDLAGRDVLDAVQVSVNPKVIQTPKVAAMAQDGIQLIAIARVTVRANINRLVGGAGYGLPINVIVGILGGVIGAKLFSAMDIPVGSWFVELGMAVLGAVLLLGLVNLVRRRAD